MNAEDARITALEQRIAGLEALLTPAVTFPAMTSEQAARFSEQFAEAVGGPPTTIPPSPPIGPDEIRALLRECVTVVSPDDVLVIRCSRITQEQAHMIREQVAAFNEANDTSVKVMTVCADEIAVAAGEPEA